MTFYEISESPPTRNRETNRDNTDSLLNAEGQREQILLKLIAKEETLDD
jgi:hypothetical protein